MINWYTCRSAIFAPFNDLKLLQELADYEKTIPSIAGPTLKTFSSHLWYLSEALVGFAFFDPRVTPDQKSLMVAALQKKGCDNPSNKAIVNLKEISKIEIHNFVTSNSKRVFDELKLPTSFFSKDTHLWENDDDFVTAKKKLEKLCVVNDLSERGVASATIYNKKITKNEDDFQNLLISVDNNRKNIPNVNKNVIEKALKKPI